MCFIVRVQYGAVIVRHVLRDVCVCKSDSAYACVCVSVSSAQSCVCKERNQGAKRKEGQKGSERTREIMLTQSIGGRGKTHVSSFSFSRYIYIFSCQGPSRYTLGSSGFDMPVTNTSLIRKKATAYFSLAVLLRDKQEGSRGWAAKRIDRTRPPT